MTLFFSGFFKILFVSLALIEVADPGSAVTEDQLMASLERAVARAEQVAKKRPFRIVAMNESLVKTSEAFGAMRRGEETAKILNTIDRALRLYSANSLARLLKAVVVDTREGPEKGNPAFEDYLLKSRIFGEFEKRFLNWREFHGLRRSVYELLLNRGIDFEGREEKIQVKEPLRAFVEYVMQPRASDQIYSYLLIALTLGGGVLLIVASMSGMSFQGPFTRNILIVYVCTWIAYAFWILDLAAGLPFGWSRAVAVPVTLGGSMAYFLFSGIYSILSERLRPPSYGMQRCPKCGKEMLLAEIECPNCHHRISSSD